MTEVNKSDRLALVYRPSSPLMADLRELGWDAISMADRLDALLTASAALLVVDLELADRGTFPFLHALAGLDRAAPLLLLDSDEALRDHIDEVRELLTEWPAPIDFVIRPYIQERLQLRLMQLQAKSPSRTTADNVDSFDMGDLHVDAGRRVVQYAGQEAALSPTEFIIVHVLIQAGGHVVRKDKLQQILQERTSSYGGGMIEVHVSRLRQKLIERGMPPAALRTARNAGYALEPALLAAASVEAAEDGGSGGVKARTTEP